VMIGGVGKEIDPGNGVGRPDDLTRLEVPPHIRIAETKPQGKYGKRQEQTRQCYGKGKNKSQQLCGT
jgi:hypothetical protein